MAVGVKNITPLLVARSVLCVYFYINAVNAIHVVFRARNEFW